MQSSSCQSWYFDWVFGYDDEQLILPMMVYFVWVFGSENEELILIKLVLCLSFCIRRCSAHPAKVGTFRVHPAKVDTLSRILEMIIQSSGFQIWYFIWVFGYEEAEFILPKLVFV